MGNNKSKQLPPSQQKGNRQHKAELVYSEEHICYEEQLFRIEGEQLKNILHRSIVALTFLSVHKRINAGSGVLISRNIVLTAAHNIFNRELNAENSDFKVYVGANGVVEEYYQAEAWKYPEDFKICKPSAKLPHDYAIMKLKKPVQFQSGYFPSLALVCQECLLRDNKQKQLNVFGFPCAYPPDTLGNVRPFEDNFKSLNKNGKRIKLYQYGLAREGRITAIKADQSKIGYGISTLPGQSGCPVTVDNYIIAVHVGGDKEQFNVGRIVDATFVDSLWKWREELNGAPFWLKEYGCKHVQDTLEKMGYKLNLKMNSLESVDLREYGNLLELNLRINELRQIDLAHCPRLIILDLRKNQLQQIDLAKLKHLTWLDLHGNQLRQINVRANVNLTSLCLSCNQLQQTDVGNNVNLTHLDMSYNKLQNMDVRANFNLTRLGIENNQLQEIDMGPMLISLTFIYPPTESPKSIQPKTPNYSG